MDIICNGQNLHPRDFTHLFERNTKLMKLAAKQLNKPEIRVRSTQFLARNTMSE